jgi:uncharacterized protein with HEPN domain
LLGRNLYSARHRRASDVRGVSQRSILRHAAAYAIQTISEAVRQIPDEWLTDFPDEPWGQIKRIGDRIRHEYFRIDDAILWQVITTHASSLQGVMEAMLRRHIGSGR